MHGVHTIADPVTHYRPFAKTHHYHIPNVLYMSSLLSVDTATNEAPFYSNRHDIIPEHPLLLPCCCCPRQPTAILSFRHHHIHSARTTTTSHDATPTLHENISRQFHTFYYYCLTLFGNAFRHLFRHLSFTSSSGEERGEEERSVLFWAAGNGTVV